MPSFPIILKLNNSIVIGGGKTALRKIQLLRQFDISVKVYATIFCTELQILEDSNVECIQAEFSPDQIQNTALVIGATNSRATNQAIFETCLTKNIPVNIVDTPEYCTFTMPAIVDRSPVLIAISTQGYAPVLSRLLRQQIETFLPSRYGKLALFANKFRESVKEKFNVMNERRKFWEEIFQGPISELVLSQQEGKAEKALQCLLQKKTLLPQGMVSLVGGGPGSPDLLTLRALQLMQNCDVCVYDKLLSAEVLALVRRDAEKIFVGKSKNKHTLPQEEINQLLVKLAKQGLKVLRLKGGDPFIFGRGGEEIETLMEHQIPFQIVPGISAANGVSAYAGIPLTHRDYAHSCIWTTGHLRTQPGETTPTLLDLDWKALIRPKQTIVIYMGLSALPQICAQLMAHGLSPDMPSAVVQSGTQSTQKVIVSSIQHLAQRVEERNLEPPCLLIIGEVVKLREKLQWF